MRVSAKQKTATERTVSGAKGLVRTSPRLGRPPRGKTLLSEERLLKTAISIIDESGVPALTMRHLAERLSVTAMSLYRYCDSHESLLDAVQQAIIDRYAPPPANNDQSYREALTEMAKALRRTFKAHPQAVVLFATRPTTRVYAHHDATLRCLAQAGFEPSIAVYLVDAIIAFTVGLSLEEFSRRPQTPLLDEERTQPAKTHRKSRVGGADSPGSVSVKPNDYETEFIVGLLAMIDGFGSRYAKRVK
jgi:AcrR family transcriptional regulator